MRRFRWTTLWVVILFAALSLAAAAQESRVIKLPAPRLDRGKPLMQVLKDRQSSRTFAPAKLPPEVLADILWAAAGINRPDEGKRTAPSARNWQEVGVYAVLEDGTYLYDAKENALNSVAGGDLRKLAGMQDFVATAPLNLLYVADPSKMKGASGDDATMYMGADAAFMAENVYLYCASEGLAVVVRASVQRDSLAQALKLPSGQKIILAQTVGYPQPGK
jgi:nitroreductase